jgi:hypothetical protein
MEAREEARRLRRCDDHPHVEHRLGQNDKALHLNLTVQDVDELTTRLEQQRTQQLGANVGETSPN